MEDVRPATIVSVGSSEWKGHLARRFMPSYVRKRIQITKVDPDQLYLGCRTWLKALHRRQKMQALFEQR